MQYELTGKLIEIYPTTEVSATFKKRDFVLEKTETAGEKTFIDVIKFQLIQDRCSLMDACRIGDEIKVIFNIKGSKWEKEGRTSYFVNLDAWKIERLNVYNTQSDQPVVQQPVQQSFETPLPEGDDNLPF